MENARLAQQKRWMIMFEKRSKKKKNSMKGKKLYKKLENTGKKSLLKIKEKEERIW